MYTFAKAIEIVVFGKARHKLDELVFVDKCGVFCCEEDVPVECLVTLNQNDGSSSPGRVIRTNLAYRSREPLTIKFQVNVRVSIIGLWARNQIFGKDVMGRVGWTLHLVSGSCSRCYMICTSGQTRLAGLILIASRFAP